MKLVSGNIVPARSANEAAAYWVMRLDAPNCTPADRAAFEKWRTAHESHAKAYALARQGLAVVDQHLGSSELAALGERVFEQTRRSRWKGCGWAGAGLAACVLIGVALHRDVALEPDVAVVPRVDLSTFETAVGERSTVVLPDDSIVTLNTDTRVEVRFIEGSDVRRVFLQRGQAHFDVEEDPRPFEVLAGGRRIEALGTTFDVRIDNELGVLVTLLEGRVAIDEGGGHAAVEVLQSSGGETPSDAEPALPTVLQAGEQLIVRPNEPQQVIPVDVEQIAGWREGRLVFRDDPLREVVKEINRYSTRKLFVDDDERLEGIQIGGVFKAGSTESFVAAVEEFYPVEARRVAWNRIALGWVDKAAANGP